MKMQNTYKGYWSIVKGKTRILVHPGGMVVNKRMYDYMHNFLFMNPQYSIRELLGIH